MQIICRAMNCAEWRNKKFKVQSSKLKVQMNKGSALNGAPVCRHCSLKIKFPLVGNLILEAWVGIEPAYKDLQSSA